MEATCSLGVFQRERIVSNIQMYVRKGGVTESLEKSYGISWKGMPEDERLMPANRSL